MTVKPGGPGRPDDGQGPEPTLADVPTIADDPGPPVEDDHGTVAFSVVANGGPPLADVGDDPGGTVAVDDPGGTVAADDPPNAATAAFDPVGPPGLAMTAAGYTPDAFAGTEVATGVDDPVRPERVAPAPDLQETEFATMAVAGHTGPSAEAPRPPSEAFCGRYLLRTFYARGGMGEVWLAEDPVIGRPVALKRILGDRHDQRRRFRVEAQITGRLEHPGIVPVHELGIAAGGEPFYVMKFVQGRTLKKVVEEFHAGNLTGGDRELEQVRLLQMFHSLCLTVGYAHSRGVLHRDLKPENVMLGPYGETILLDWGIAKVIGQPDEAAGGEGGPPGAGTWLGESLPDTGTHFGAVLGTPSYMSPEVAAGLTDEVDERSDIYLLGATLYEILTGSKPRSAKSVFETLAKAKTEPPKPARTVNPLVPRALEAVCLKAMAHRKEDRYQTATGLAEDVQRFIAGEPVSAHREGPLARAWRWARRNQKAIVRSAAAVLIGGLALFAFARVRDAERRRNEAAALAGRLKAEDQARRDLQEFRRLADEASFYAATTEPVSEHAPYYDPLKGEATAAEAIAIAAKWGPLLEKIPLPSERADARARLYQLTLLTAHMQSRRQTGPSGARQVLAILDRADKLAGPTAGAYRLRALAYERLGETGKTAEMRARADDPHTPTTAQDHFLQGERHRDESAARVGEQTDRKPWQPDPARMERAIAEYRKALAIDPDHFWARLQLGRCYQSLERYSEATEALGACVAIRPDAPWGYTALGLALAQQGRYDEAEQDLNRAIRIGPDNRPARLHRGVVYWRQKKYGEALADFEAVLAPPDSRRLIEAASYRGQLYYDLDQADKALADFDRVVAVSPGFRSVYQYRPILYLLKGETDRALADLDTYVRLSRPTPPEGWEVHGLRGRLLRSLYTELPLDKRKDVLGKILLNLASAELFKALKMGGQAAGLFDDLGAVLEHSGDLKRAIAAYSRGLEFAPDYPKLLIKRAWAYEQLKQYDKASADFAAAARSDPANAEAHTGLGYVQALRALPPDAQREADLALLNGGDNYLVLHNVACIYATLARTDDPQSGPSRDVALALLRRSVKLWKQKGTAPSEFDLMKGEPAFQSLRGRKDFQELLKSGDTKTP